MANDDDFILHVSDDNCNRFDSMLKDTKNNGEAKAMYDRIDADLEATLFPELRILTGMTDASTTDMHNVCNYLYWAKLNWKDQVEMKFELSDEQYNQCLISVYRKEYYKFDATWELTY